MGVCNIPSESTVSKEESPWLWSQQKCLTIHGRKKLVPGDCRVSQYKGFLLNIYPFLFIEYNKHTQFSSWNLDGRVRVVFELLFRRQHVHLALSNFSFLFFEFEFWEMVWRKGINYWHEWKFIKMSWFYSENTNATFRGTFQHEKPLHTFIICF